VTGSDETLAVIDAVFAAFNAHEIEQFRVLLAPDVVMPDSSGVGPDLHGPEAVVSAVSVMADAFPDLRVTVRNAFADGERGVAEVLREGTHTGPLNLPTGAVPPTGKLLRLPESVVFVVRDGKVISMTANTDILSGMAQLGLIG
jgi:steroid delta-isomerase-like uncharacterized protein